MIQKTSQPCLVNFKLHLTHHPTTPLTYLPLVPFSSADKHSNSNQSHTQAFQAVKFSALKDTIRSLLNELNTILCQKIAKMWVEKQISMSNDKQQQSVQAQLDPRMHWISEEKITARCFKFQQAQFYHSHVHDLENTQSKMQELIQLTPPSRSKVCHQQIVSFKLSPHCKWDGYVLPIKPKTTLPFVLLSSVSLLGSSSP